MHPTEETFIFLKPDALESIETTAKILERISNAGFMLSQAKYVQVTPELIATHYQEVIEKYGPSMQEKLTRFFAGKHVLLFIAHRENAVAYMREIIGATDPAQAAIGTIRRDFSTDSLALAMQEGRVVRNLIHASDSAASVLREKNIWYK